MVPSDALTDDDVALVLRPNFTKDKWNGTLDLNVVIMPRKKAGEDSNEALEDITNLMVTCFRLLTSDEDFYNQVLDATVEMIENGEHMDQDAIDEVENLIDTSNNVYKLHAWTKTKGNA
jgi:hypothetical protein